MTCEAEPENQTILSVLEALEQGTLAGLLEAPDASTGADGGEAGSERRHYVELLGLLPEGLVPVARSPAVYQRLLASIQSEPKGTAPDLRPFPRVAAPLPRRTQAPSRWPLALAASLALLFGGLSAWLYSDNVRHQDEIDGLTSELTQLRQQIQAAGTQRAQLEAQLQDVHGNLALVATPGVEISPLRPVPGSTVSTAAARGVLFVASDHQHWYLSVHGLAPLGTGQSYRLWFLADTGAVSGGQFSGQPDEPMQLSSKHMPAGTKAVVITLEPDDPTLAAPSGPRILEAAPPIQVL